MSVESDFILWALAEVSTPGEILPPEGLLAVAATDPDPIAALSDHDRTNALFAALVEEFGFLEFVRRTQTFPATEMQQRIVGLLRWTIHGCRDWRLEEDPRHERLVSIFVVTQYCGHAGKIWSNFPVEAANERLSQELAALLGRMRINIGMQGFSRSPISDAEAISEFNLADESGNWPVLAEHLRHLDDRWSPKTFSSQAAQYLHRFFPETLVEIASSARQTFFATQLLEPLSAPDACEVALRSGNAYVEFVTAYRCAVWDRTAKAEPEDQRLQLLISDLLVKVARDAPRWSLWMQAFCRYPQYYPSIAKALGRALAGVQEDAIGPYVDAIVLTSMRSASRSVVAETLGSFRSEASIERRRYLWKRAFERWEKWEFGSQQFGIAFHQIAFSELDYAIVGYALECMSEDDCQRELVKIRGELSKLGDRWFRTVSDFGNEKYRLLSVCQPFAHATTTPANWLATGEYLPYDPGNDRYIALALGVI